ncbi:hypothetical protein [Polyangium sp. y55x31]|uniref:hypothetical protein n=1 Tax=Polyangium sp. y55x31 TaxID=3042688 RepID=UPI002482BACA|nr:hypothetical protein [Polyangium sp. y55x31]MDI1483574.1 hypothetical protein [Polyangium sp. y55x31]
MVHSLNEDGRWLRIEPMTWRELAAALPGWRIPDHAEPDGTATYLFTLLDGEGRPAAETFGQAGPKLRDTSPKRQGHPGTRRTTPSRARIETPARGEASREDESLATPAPAPAPEPAPATAPADEPAWKRGWDALVQAHAARSEAVYRVRPLRPKIPVDEQEAMGGCIASTSITLAALVRERTGIVLEPNDALEKLAAQVMVRWFKRPGTNNYLLQSRHRLRSLYEEIDARASEALEDLVGQFVKANPPAPRRPVPPAENVEMHGAREALTQFLGTSMVPGEHRYVHELPSFLTPTPIEQHDEELELAELPEPEFAEAVQEQDDEAVELVPPETPAEPLNDVAAPHEEPVRSEGVDTRTMHRVLIPRAELTPDVEHVLDGFAERPELAELAEHTKLAAELLTLARERGAPPEKVVAALDAASLACMRLKVPTTAAKTSAVYRSVLEALETVGEASPKPDGLGAENEPLQVETKPARPRGLPGARRWGNTPVRAARVRVVKVSPEDGADDGEEPPPFG